MAHLTEQVFHRAKSPALTQVQDHDMRAQVLKQAQQVRADDNSRACLRSFADGLLYPADTLRIEPRQRFIEQDDFRVVQKGTSDRNLLAHPARQVMDKRIALVREFERRKKRFGILFEVREFVSGCGEREVFPNRHGVKEPWIIGNVAQVAFGCDGRLGNIMSGNQERPRTGRNNSAQRAQGRCLARPIRP